MSSPRRLFRRLSPLVAAGAFRPGSTQPGANAPFAAAPPPDQAEARRASSAPVRRSMRISVIEGVSAEVVTACAGGAVFTGWAVFLGCSPLLVGMLGALPFLSQLVQFPSAWLVGALGHRRVCLVAVSASRLCLLPLVFLPLSPLTGGAKQALLLGTAAVSATLGVLGNNAWVSWMGDLVPRRIRGRYFGRRTALCTLCGTIAALIAGAALDGAAARDWTGPALSALAAVACLSGLLSTFLMSQQHAPAPLAAPPMLRLREVLAPLSDAEARRYVLYLVVWNAAIGVSGAYYALHMLKNLELGFTLVALHGASVAGMRMLSASLWGSAVDRFGAKPVLVACTFGLALTPLYWLATDAGFLWPLALDVVVSGALWSGHNVAAFTMPLTLAPARARSYYLALFSMSGGTAYAAMTFLGGLALLQLPARASLGGWPVTGFHALFALSGLGRLAAGALATRVVERGARPVDELARWVRTGASARVGRVAGLLRR